MLEWVITGGQTGVDQAGWRAAKAAGFATGGFMPMGFRTEGQIESDGSVGPDEAHPEFADLYGARDLESLEYRVRTRANDGGGQPREQIAGDRGVGGGLPGRGLPAAGGGRMTREAGEGRDGGLQSGKSCRIASQAERHSDASCSAGSQGVGKRWDCAFRLQGSAISTILCDILISKIYSR